MNKSHTIRYALLRAAAIGFAVAVSACAVGPDYQKPDTALPQNWISADDKQGGDNQTAIQQAWWQNFHDPVLNRLIQKAASGNFDVKIAEARIAEARAERAAADSSLLPSGDLKATGTRQANQIAFPGGDSSFASLLTKPFNTFETGFDASWELDLFGGHRREAEAANATFEASEASRDDAVVSLMAEVARTYLDIRKYQAQTAVAQDTFLSYQDTGDIAKQRFDVGDTAGIDVTQAKAQREQAQAQIATYHNLLAQAEYGMDVLLGEKPGAAHVLVTPPAAIPASDQALVLAAPASVIANRPDIRAAERKLAAATAQQGAAVAKFFPDISLTGFIGLLNTNANNLLSANSKSWMMGGSVIWPILSYGTLSANLDASNAQQQEAMAVYQKTIIGALSDVERSVTAYNEQEKYRQSLEASTADTRHAAEIARQRYEQGLTSFLEVLDAERTLYTSQNQLAEANAQTSQNLIAVYKSLGGGWKL